MILNEVGISKGALYWHFAKKEDIFEEAFEYCYQKILEHSRVDIDENAPAIDCLKKRLKNIVTLNKKDPHCIIFLIKFVLFNTKYSDSFLLKELYTDIVKFIKKGLANKEIVDLPESFLVFNEMYIIGVKFIEYLNKYPETYENEALIDKINHFLHKSMQA